MNTTQLSKIQPYIRFVNNYQPIISYTENPRIIFDYEFMYTMEGSVDISYCDKIYTLNKSDLLYFRPFDKNFMIVDHTKNFRTHCIHFDWIKPDDIYDFTAEEFYTHSVLSPDHHEKLALLHSRPVCEPCDFNIPTYTKGLPHNKFSELFSKCYYEFLQDTPASHLRLKSFFYEIVAELYTCVFRSDSEKIMHPKIKYAIQYIKSNYTLPLTAPSLAYKFDLSPKYFGTLFKSSTGMGVSEFIQKLRIDAAKEMLLGTSMTVSEISQKLGFNNPFYFSNCFKAAEDLSPTEYRALITQTADLH